MDIYSVETLGNRYRLSSLTAKDCKTVPPLSKNEILLYPSAEEKKDFCFDFCDTDAYLCALICAYHLFFERGLPLDELTLYHGDTPYSCTRLFSAAHICVPTGVRVFRAELLGVDFELCEGADGRYRVLYVKHRDSLDDAVLRGLLLHGAPSPSCELIIASGEGSEFTVEHAKGEKKPLDLSALCTVARYLSYKRVCGVNSVINDCYGSVHFTPSNSGIRIGLSPRLHKM